MIEFLVAFRDIDLMFLKEADGLCVLLLSDHLLTHEFLNDVIGNL